MFLQELKNASDIEQVISSYVKLRRRGRVATGLCPFHSEKSPSFTVYPDNQSFYCFGCGAGGDVVTFIRRIENLEYVEAVRMLAQRAGMELPEYDGEDSRILRLKPRLLEANRALARFYHECLKQPEGKEGLEYLHARGLTNKTIVRFGLGFAPDGWGSALKYMKGKGFSEEELFSAAIVARGERGTYYDVFRNRVMFPIIDLRGNVVAFGGRIMGDAKGPKYLNSGDTPVFKKSRNLFALNFAKASKQEGLLLCEGYMDVISVHQAGFDNGVATLGTALTSEQARLVSQYAQMVTLCYDSDEAGQTATRRATGLLEEVGVKVRVLSIPNAKDPDEFIKRFGAERFGLLIKGAANATEFEVEKLKARFDLETADGKVAFMREFVKLLLRVPNPIEREVYVAKTANELGLPKEPILVQYEYERKRAARRGKQKEQELRIFSEVQTKQLDRPFDYQRSRNLKFALAEDKLLAILMRNPDYYEHAASRIGPGDFITDRNRALAQVLFERLGESRPVDLTLLSAVFSIEQMGVITELCNSISGMTFSESQMDSYIDTILSYRQQKTKDEVAAMTEDDLKAYIASLASKKK